MRYTNLLGPSILLLLVACSETREPEDAAGFAGAAGDHPIEAGGAPSDAGAGGESASGGVNAAGDASGAGGASAAGGAGDAGAPGSAGAATFECDGEGARFVTGVVDFAFGDGQDHGQDEFPQPILGAPLGAGCCQGSLDVTSLGEGGFVVLEFEDNVIIDGAGPDFIVFENPFVPQGAADSAVFAEVGSVSVSQDGVAWFDYPCTADEYPFGACAGWRAVLANADENDVSPFDPEAAGGDAYDLSELGLDWVRYVRIEDRADLDGTFDLDAVAIANAGCE